MMGVTTEITGEGESIAPINDRILKEQEDFNRRFNLTVDWHTLDEYFRRLERNGSAINLGTYVGAAQVRQYVLGNALKVAGRAAAGMVLAQRQGAGREISDDRSASEIAALLARRGFEPVWKDWDQTLVHS